MTNKYILYYIKNAFDKWIWEFKINNDPISIYGKPKNRKHDMIKDAKKYIKTLGIDYNEVQIKNED